MIRVEISNRSGHPIPRRFLLSWTRKMAKKVAAELGISEQIRGKELLLVGLARADAKRLNRKFRGRNYPTDILSFAPVSNESLGELVLCPTVISCQAKEHGLLVREEWAYIVLHGFLHLLGFDHETSQKDADVMFALQDRLFAELLPAS